MPIPPDPLLREDILLLKEELYVAFVGDTPQFTTFFMLTQTAQSDFGMAWDITEFLQTDFSAYIELTKRCTSEFSGSFCLKATDNSGGVGHPLSMDADSPVGFLPPCSTSGIPVTLPLDFSIDTTLGATVPAELNWNVIPGGDVAGGKGEIEWVRVKIVYDADYRTPGFPITYVREHLIIPGLDDSLSGIFHKTHVRSEATGYSGIFSNMASGTYVIKAEVKQSCNASPYVCTSGFTVGEADYFEIAASSVATRGTAPFDAEFTSARIDQFPEETTAVHWDFGNQQILGTNIDSYRNLTYTYARQGYYNPVVTYVLDNGYILSKVLDPVYGGHSDRITYF